MADELNDDQWAQIDAEITSGHMIPAIKLYREFTNSDLKDSKDACEARLQQLKAADPRKFAIAAQRKGCMPVLLLMIAVSFAYGLIAVLSASRNGN